MAHQQDTDIMQHWDILSEMKKSVKRLKDLAKDKMEKMRQKFEDEESARRSKDALLVLAEQRVIQEREKRVELEKSVLDVMGQLAQKHVRIQELESIEAELRKRSLEDQHLLHEAEYNVMELQQELQKVTLKLHEIEGQIVDLESKWVITPLTQSYSGVKRARSCSADQILSQTSAKPCPARRRSLDHDITQKISKKETPIVKQPRRSFSSTVTPIIESPYKTPLNRKTTDEDDVFVAVQHKHIVTRHHIEPTLEVPKDTGVKAVVKAFEKFNPVESMKGAVPKKRLFQSSKRRILNLEQTEIDGSKCDSRGATWKSRHESMAVPASPSAALTRSKEVTECVKFSAKRCLSPSLSVGRVKKLRPDEPKQRKSLLPRTRRKCLSFQKLQPENVRSALLCATRREDINAIRRLATAAGGASLLDMPVVNVFKFTPLHLAASWGYVESARALLDSGAAIEVQDWVSSTPLHIAAHWGHAKMCRLLLGHGAQVMARNSNNETPLHLAARQGHLQVVRLMVDDWWAELDAKDCTGRTAWDVAHFWKKTDVAHWLSRQTSLKKRFGRIQRSYSLPSEKTTEE